MLCITADNVVVSASTDSTIALWDLSSSSSSAPVSGLSRVEQDFFDTGAMLDRVHLEHKPNSVSTTSDHCILIADSSSSITSLRLV